MDNARRRVQLGMILAEIARISSPNVTRDTVKERIEEMSRDYEDPDEFVKYYMSNQELLRGVETLVMEDEKSNPLIVLMHGDREVSTKALARAISVKTVSPCTAETARKQTGYQVGGTSPFATRKTLPVYMEKTIQDLQTIYINGGKRGFLVEMSPRDMINILTPTVVEVGIKSD
jgi:Cys-tRNA(Pro) deacylase